MNLKVNNLSFSYIKNKDVLKNIDLELFSGDIVAILGENGAGKSTLIKCFASILKPNKGEIYLNDINLNSLKSNEKAKLISYVPQHIEFPNVNVYEAILIGRKPYIQFEPKKEDHKIINEAISLLNLNELAFKNVNELSGGEKQKVAIARAISQSSSVILFDEPTSNLDIKNQLEVIRLIKKIVKEKNMIAIVVIHDINLALKLANKFILMKDGSIISKGNDEIINETNLNLLYGVNSIIYQKEDKKYVLFND